MERCGYRRDPASDAVLAQRALGQLHRYSSGALPTYQPERYRSGRQILAFLRQSCQRPPPMSPLTDVAWPVPVLTTDLDFDIPGKGCDRVDAFLTSVNPLMSTSQRFHTDAGNPPGDSERIRDAGDAVERIFYALNNLLFHFGLGARQATSICNHIGWGQETPSRHLAPSQPEMTIPSISKLAATGLRTTTRPPAFITLSWRQLPATPPPAHGDGFQGHACRDCVSRR